MEIMTCLLRKQFIWLGYVKTNTCLDTIWQITVLTLLALGQNVNTWNMWKIRHVLKGGVESWSGVLEWSLGDSKLEWSLEDSKLEWIGVLECSLWFFCRCIL